ncbi:MAG: hypothetical protein ACN6O9_23260, partial [Agrobacterium tumefaciens]
HSDVILRLVPRICNRLIECKAIKSLGRAKDDVEETSTSRRQIRFKSSMSYHLDWTAVHARS